MYLKIVIYIHIFQFTLPHRERRACGLLYSVSLSFQFTLPHRERQTNTATAEESAAISIHAPAQGATNVDAS